MSSGTHASERGYAPAEEQSMLGSVKTGCRKCEEYVRDNPGSSMAIGLVAGLGVGVAVGLLLGRPSPPPSHRWFDRRSAERLGHQILESVGRVLPDSIMHRS